MKKDQLLLFVLLFTSDGLLITKGPENIHPASIKNIKKPTDESSRIEKHNPPETPSNLTNIKLKKEERDDILLLAWALTNFWGNALGGFVAGSFIKDGMSIIEKSPLLIPSGIIIGNFPIYMLQYSPAYTTQGIIASSLGTGYIYHQLLDIQPKCHDLFNKKNGLSEEKLACLFRLLGLSVGVFFGIYRQAR